MRFRGIQEALDSAEPHREIEQAAERGVRILCERDAEFPAGLKNIHDPPVCIYVSGEIQPADILAVAVVGSRQCTRYGGEQAQRFAALLAGAGFTIVSGLARGIDGFAHQGALEAGGRTLAVLGNGLTQIYPREHAGLAERVRRHGAVISELPMGTPPEATNFEPRNRIIAGLSLGVLVVEAAKQSGALITARLAADYNREIFALPGRIDTPSAMGTNALIRDGGAKLVACLEDVLDGLGDVGRLMAPAADAASGDGSPVTAGMATASSLDSDQRAILAALDGEEQGLESLAVETGLAIPRLMALLMGLRLSGFVKELPGQRFTKVVRPGV
jgi:DNA processing protein